MSGYCTFTVWAPDPQDCGEASIATLRGEPLCGFHYAGALWAEAHQEEK